MPTNFYMYFLAGLIPLMVGAIYYSKVLFGSAWMTANGFKESDLEGGNMAMIFGLSYLLGVILSFSLGGIVVHQTNVFQMMMPDVLAAGPAQELFNDLMAQYGDRHRSFGHGAIHGAIITLLFILPIIAINALFERRGGKYIWIHTGYWLISTCLIGGLLCATLEWAPL